MSTASFSFRELSQAAKVELAPIETLSASDGIPLAYRRYAPDAPRAALLFYHGGGAHSGAGYQFIGSGLKTQFGTLVYQPDIRGHGASGGPRGDAPNPQQVWTDITTMLEHIRAEHPGLPLFLGGHSSGAALALNYLSQPGHGALAGYVFLSPQLGFRAQADRPALAAPFVKVDTEAFAAYGASGGREHGHDRAVQFNYSAELLASDPGMVPSITVNMSVALTPFDPAGQFAALDRPFGLWIGAEDELFLPEKVLAFAALAAQPGSVAKPIPGAKHLSVLVNAHETIGPWLMGVVKGK